MVSFCRVVNAVIHEIAKRIVHICIRHSGYPAEKTEIYAYGLECGMADLLQYLILGAIAVVFRCPVRLLLFCVCFTGLKRNAGGYHARTHFACITQFTACATLSALIAPIPEPWAARGLVLGCAAALFLLVWRNAPIAHPNHPKSESAHRRSRRVSIAVAAVEALLLPILSLLRPEAALAGALGGLCAAATLVIPNEKEVKTT